MTDYNNNNTGAYNTNTDRTGHTDSNTAHPSSNQHTGIASEYNKTHPIDNTGFADSTTHHNQNMGTGAYNTNTSTTDRTGHGLTDSTTHQYDNNGGISNTAHTGQHAGSQVTHPNTSNPSHILGVTSAYIPPGSTGHAQGGVFDHPDDSRTGGVFDKRDGEQEPHGHAHDKTHHDTHGMGTTGGAGGVASKLDPTSHTGGTHAHNPTQHASIADKVFGKVEQVAGKMTHNPGLAEKGELRATAGKSAVQDYHAGAAGGAHDTTPIGSTGNLAHGRHDATGHGTAGHKNAMGQDTYPTQ